MKRTIIIILVSMMPLTVFAQSNAFEKFKNKYEQDREATSVTINGSLFQLLANIAQLQEDKDEDMEILARLSSKVVSMHILSLPMYYTGLDEKEINTLKNKILDEHYEELMNMKDNEKSMNFYAVGNDESLRNVLVLITENQRFTILNVDGDLDLKDLSELAKNHHNFH